MVGGAVFTTSGFALGDLGSRAVVLLAWVIGGVLALLGALSYGALALRFPQSGGEYEFIRRIWHPLLGFLAGWVSLIVGFTAPIAFAGAALQHYLAPVIGTGFGEKGLGTIAIVAAGITHAIGVRRGAKAQDVFVLIKLSLIFALVVGGAAVLLARGPVVESAIPATAAGGATIAAFATTLVWVYLAYSGWNAAVYIGGEVENPQRNLPRSLLIGTSIVVLLYLGLNAVFLYSAPWWTSRTRPRSASWPAPRSVGGGSATPSVSSWQSRSSRPSRR